MPRNGSGVYDLPDGYLAETGETILATQHNTPLEDLEADANNARPIVAGGTGASSAVDAHDNLTAAASIAAASTTDLADVGPVVTVTGNATITSFGSAPNGAIRFVTFTGSSTITHNDTSLMLPGGRSIATVPGDSGVFRSLGSGNWRALSYTLASRELLSAGRTYFVRADGSDSNNGLSNTSGGAFLTLQRAWDVISGTLDMGGNLVTVQVGDGNYGAGMSDGLKPIIGGRVLFQGNLTTPANVTIAATSDDCFEISDSVISVTGFRLSNSGGSALHAYRSGVINFENVEFGDCLEAHVFCDNQGQAIGSGGYSIVGDAPSHWVAHTGGLITVGGRTITLSGSRAFSQAFAYAHAGIIEAVSNTYSGSTPTGRKFVVDGNGTIYTGSTTLTELPGNTAGDLLSGTYGTDISQTQGTWTPTYLGLTSGGTTTYTTQTGWYVRNGKMVHFGGIVAWSNATGTGQAIISIPPISAALDAVINMYYSNHTIGSGKQGVAYLQASTAQRIGLYASDPAGGAGASVAVDSAGEIRFTGSYVAA